MRVFLDTNVFMEFIERRQQFADVSLIIDAIQERRHEAFISTGCIYTLTFLFERALKHQDIHKPELTERLRGYLTEVLNLAETVGLSYVGTRRAVSSEAFTDIEDSFQYQCALENRCDVLVTINERDFANVAQACMEILTPKQFVEKYL